MVDVADSTIFLTLAGSQAHGTAREGSDVDLRGVCVAPLGERLSLFGSFEQYEGELPNGLADRVLPYLGAHQTALAVKAECVVFDVEKFLRLCTNANPNALEILFADERDWVLETPAWRRLYAARHEFLTRQVQQTFMGYAMAQLKKIKSHRAWLLNPPTRKPSRDDFGLPAAGGALSRDDQHRIEQSIAEKIRSYGVDNIEMPKPARIAVQERLGAFLRDQLAASEEDVDERLRAVATHGLGLPADVVAALNAEKRYRAAMRQWESYQTWKAERNPARAELERRHGYDTKHAMHLIRLMRMGLEVLQGGELLVRRPDAAELCAIRDGALPFDDLLAAAAELRRGMERAAANSPLPADVDHARVDALAVELMTALHGARGSVPASNMAGTELRPPQLETQMTKPLEFFFDIGSTYSYLASTQVDALGERLGVEVVWRPFLLGGVFKATGNQTPANIAAKGFWMLQDVTDWAEFYGIPFAMNPTFPPNTLLVQRALVAALVDLGHDRMRLLAQALFRGYWVDGADVSDSEVFKSIALAAGCDGTMIWARATDQDVKDKLRADTDEALARGAFGAPTFFYGDRMWWGNDRLPLLERHLAAPQR